MMKVVWFCPLNIIPYSDKVKFLNNKFSVILAPWIDNYINLFRNSNELELHIIAEFPNLIKDTSFMDGNIHFYLLSQKMPFLKRGWPHVFRYFSNYFFLNRKVKKIVKKIKPDFIHLHGTEHDLSAVALNFKKIPMLVTIQGFLNEAIHKNNTFYLRNKLKIENLVLKNCKNFGVRVQFMEDIIKKYNPTPTFYYHDYILEKPKYTRLPESDAHVVFAARICRDKGIEDLILALKLVKKNFPNLKFKILGSIDENYKKNILNLLKKNGLLENTNLIGFLPDINEVHKEVAKSLINVLPTYYDIVSGTIVESMYIGVPVIAYNVGAINELNSKRESLIVVDKENIEELAKSIHQLLLDNELRDNLSQNALITVNEIFVEKDNIKKLVSIYKEIAEEKNKKKLIQ